MQAVSRFGVVGLLAAGLLANALPARAQTFGFSVAASASSVSTNDFLTYTITVTNISGQSDGIFVTNTFSANASLFSATPTVDVIGTNVDGLVFGLSPFLPLQVAQFTLTVMAEAIGPLTNTVVAVDTSGYSVSTDVVVQVTNTPPPAEADLGVSLTGPPQALIVNDLTSYAVSVTNAGPDAAPAVVLSNSLPAGLKLLSVSPAGQVSATASNVVVNVGTLTNGGFKNFTFNVQPTNTGALPISACASAASVTDLNTNNNLAATNLVVGNYLSTNLQATLVSTQWFDRQVTLMDQTIQLTNAGTNDVPSARVVVSGLNNVLFNAVGTNGVGANASPFVVYAANLPAGQSVSLRLQFAPNRTPFPLANSQLHAYGVPAYNLAPPPNPGTPVPVGEIFQLPSGGMLLQFPSFTNRTYTVVYSDDASFSNARVALPDVRSQANWAEWIDYGPPATVSAPTNTASRFFRVYLRP